MSMSDAMYDPHALALAPGQRYVSEVERPDRGRGVVWTYDGPAVSNGLHRFTRGDVFIFSGDGWLAVADGEAPSAPEPAPVATVWFHDVSAYGNGGDDYGTREEAIAAGLEEYKGAPFHVFACSPISAADMVSRSCGHMFEHIKERVWEEFATEDEREPPWGDEKAAEAELNAFLREWATRHLTADWRTVSAGPERIEPEKKT